MKRFYLDSVDSTNDYCKKNLSFLPSFCVVYTFNQTHGKGRNQRTWVSVPYQNLSFSIVVKKTIAQPASLSIIAALAMIQTLKHFQIEVQIKWPNDILIHKKKVCGILIEAITQDTQSNYVIGIGLNVNTTFFDETLKKKATSLFLELNKKISLKKVLSIYLKKWHKLFVSFKKNKDIILQEYKKYSCVLHQKIEFEYQGQFCNGEVLDILDDGSLLVQMNNKKITINYGEVSLKNFYEEGV